MKVTWGISDGYVGSHSRSHTTEINDQDLVNCETEEEREDLISEVIQGHFEQKVIWTEISRTKNSF